MSNSSDWETQEEAFFGKAISKPSPKQSKHSNNATIATKDTGKAYLNKVKARVSELSHSTEKGVRNLLQSNLNLSSNGISPTNNALARYPGNNRKPSAATTVTTVRNPPAVTRNRENNSPFPNQPSPPSRPTRPTFVLQQASARLGKNLKRMVPFCTVCGKLFPSPYRYNPYFPSEIACSSHEDITTCTACNRFEPGHGNTSQMEFADLEDNGRKLCSACLRTVIVDSNDAIPLWNNVINFFDLELGLFPDSNIDADTNLRHVKSQMKEIPILIVNHDGLNDPLIQGSGHGQGNTRGLCMFEYRYLSSMVGGGYLKEFLNKRKSRGVFQSVLTNISNSLSSARITAILCLKGLPRDLVSSILAHEATHAWFKLHPNFDPSIPIPLQVEEGCCQLSAYLYLAHLGNDRGPDDSNGNDGSQPSNAELRQYFRHCIETDQSEIYGDGFRQAAKAYAKYKCVSVILEHVMIHKCFPS